MSREFSLFCQLELERRKGLVADVMTSDIFNPNMKTTFYIDGLQSVPESLMTQLEALQVGIQESS